MRLSAKHGAGVVPQDVEAVNELEDLGASSIEEDKRELGTLLRVFY
jgi:hypothetical protein